ncbi:MAG: hypothetical protein J5859_02390, partial [Clostridia bacterium]|nr:hypothetical protein [Clostridia bacterium]
HIGLKSRYVTPKADRRLHHTRRFTLSKSLGMEDTVIYVDESPLGSPMNGKCRYLQIGTEIISYAGYTDRRPYCFTGCVRGAFATDILPHDEGSSAGTLDISEFGGTSCYIDQDTDLQDEIAQKIADVYNCGFRFCYMDGSEGTNAPHARHVPGAQMRVYSLLREKPLFTEGAAKAHFSWHFQAGGNAFDVFPPEVFKRMIARFPLEEAPRMKQDFTRLDFGWWAFRLPEGESEGTQADQYEYGTSKAAAWDCPATMQANIERFRLHPRTDDILEVMRRWEEARCTGLLTDEVKERLRDPESEFTLLRDGSGSLVLCKYERLETCAHITAYAFAYEEKTCAVYWHNRSEGRLKLPLAEGSFLLRDELCGNEVTVENQEGYTVIPAGGKRYIVSDISPEKLRETFERAVLL